MAEQAGCKSPPPDSAKPAATGSSSGGWKIKREIDLTAVLGFALALVIAGITAQQFLKGPQIMIAPPLTAILYSEDYNGSRATRAERQPQIRFVVDMTYGNTASSGIEAIVAAETLDFEVTGETFHQRGRYAVDADTEQYSPKDVCPSPARIEELKQAHGDLNGFRFDGNSSSDKAPIAFGCHAVQYRKLIMSNRKGLDRVVPGNTGISHHTVFEGAYTGSTVLFAQAFEEKLAKAFPDVEKSAKPQFLAARIKLGIIEVSGKVTRLTCSFTITENERRLFRDRGWFSLDRFDSCQ